MFDHLITKHSRKAQKWDTIEFFFSPIQTLHIDPEDVINSKIERYSPIAQIVDEIPYIIITIKDKDVRIELDSIDKLIHYCRNGVPREIVLKAINEPRNIRYRGEWNK